METMLSRQLQQAFLETQMRKQKGDLSSSSMTSNSHGVFNPSSQQYTSSSSSSSCDPGAEESSVSVPLMQAQSPDEGTFHDPALQYISKMLMDEDLDDRKCMMAEGLSYFTLAKGFYEILGSNEVPLLPCLSEPEALKISGQAVKEEVHAQSVNDVSDASQHDSSSSFPPYVYEDDGHLGVFADEGDNFWVSTQNDEKIRVSAQNGGEFLVDGPAFVNQPLKVSAKEEYSGIYRAEEALNSNGEELQWINDFLGNLDDTALEQNAPADVVESLQASSFANLGHSVSSASSTFLSQHSFDGSSHTDTHEQDPLFKLDSTSPSSVLGGSSSVGFSWSNTKAPHAGIGNGKLNPLLGATVANSRWSHGTNKLYTRSASGTTNTLPFSKTSLATSNGRFKRAASEINASVAFDSSSITSGSNGVVLESNEEEVVSFVRNKDLNAEKYGSILNEGIGAMKKGGLCGKSSKASTRDNVGKPTIVITTVADLKGLLLSCAQAVSTNNIRRANEILQEIRQDATPYGNGLQRLAHYFSEGLVARLSGTGERLYSVFLGNSPSAAKLLKAHHDFVEVCPFVKISHYFANRAIVEAAKGASRLHIIDYGILYGIQWPCLISALAERKGGPPLLRITGIDFPQPGMLQAERVEMTGKRLAEYAKAYGVPFEYQAIASRWETIQPSSLNLKKEEVVVVNSMHRLHHLLDETVVASNPRKTVLSKIREINPKIFVLGVKNGNYNVPFFMSRFKEALAAFSGYFDLLETLMRSDSQERMLMERELFGKSILNIVACEGPERIERPETYRQWQNRTIRAGLDLIPLDKNVLKESQAMVKCGYNKNFTVDEDGSWMLLSWKGKVAHGLSLWKPSSG